MSPHHEQVVAMLRDALEQVERYGGVGIELVLTTGDGVSSYKYYNSDAAQLDAAAMALFDAPCDGGGAVMRVLDLFSGIGGGR